MNTKRCEDCEYADVIKKTDYIHIHCKSKVTDTVGKLIERLRNLPANTPINGYSIQYNGVITIKPSEQCGILFDSQKLKI